MDLSGAQWLSEFEEANGSAFINQWQMKSVDNSVNNLCFNHHSSESYSAYPSSSTESIQERSQAGMARSAKEVKNNDFSSYTSAQKGSQKVSPSASPNIFSFGDSRLTKSSIHGKRKYTVKTEADMMSLGEMDFSAQISPSSIQQIYGTVEYGEPVKRGCNRTPLQAEDHVLAERKRRERLSDRFVALSAIVPGLKRLDKASVLAGAIKYLEQMQERIKLLEDEKRRQQESVNISSQRPRLTSSGSSSDEESDSTVDQSVSDIEVRTSDSNVLVRVYCQKRSGIIREILCEIERLNVAITSSSVIPFGDTTFHITVIGQMDSEVCLSLRDIANNIRTALQKRM